jgi:hypothetical protein
MNEHSLTPLLIAATPPTLIAVAALLGWWNSKRQQPASVRLITLQGDVAEAEKGKVEAERESLAVASLSKSLADADRTLDRLRVERDDALRHAGAAEVAKEEAKRQVELYELQMNKVRALLKDNNLEFPN